MENNFNKVFSNEKSEGLDYSDSSSEKTANIIIISCDVLRLPAAPL